MQGGWRGPSWVSVDVQQVRLENLAEFEGWVDAKGTSGEAVLVVEKVGRQFVRDAVKCTRDQRRPLTKVRLANSE